MHCYSGKYCPTFTRKHTILALKNRLPFCKGLKKKKKRAPTTKQTNKNKTKTKQKAVFRETFTNI